MEQTSNPFVSVVEAHTYLLKQFWGMASTQARGALTPAQSEALDTLRYSMRAMIAEPIPNPLAN